MTAVAVHKFAQSVTCHAWSPDQSMIALCPNTEDVHIYKSSEGKWEKIYVLQKHDQVVCGIDWSSKTNKIVTVSHDRNSYVWNKEKEEWVPTLVILRLNRAALCVQWSPAENKFAVGSGAKTVCICYYEQENNWWVSKLIRKKHDSSVTSVAWHPNNILLATTSTDGKCRVFSTFIKGVDKKGSESSSSSGSKFGEQIIQLDLSYSWAFGVRWSPSGKTLAYVGHNSMIYFVDDVGPSPLAQSVAFRDLPLRDVLFVSDKVVIGVGFDCNPMVFAADDSGLWCFVKFLEERQTLSTNARYGSQLKIGFGLDECCLSTGQILTHLGDICCRFFANGCSGAESASGAFGKLYGQSKYGFANDTTDDSNTTRRAHENCITSIVPLKKGKDLKVTRFSTSGIDGKVVIWELGSHDFADYR